MTAADLSLPDFLLARYAEEEAVAARADGSEWRAVSEKYPIGAFKGGHLVHVHAPRWRADIEAKRQIVELHRASTDHGEGFTPYCVGCWEEGGMDGAPNHPCRTVRFLTLPYADHPDFQESWRG